MGVSTCVEPEIFLRCDSSKTCVLRQILFLASDWPSQLGRLASEPLHLLHTPVFSFRYWEHGRAGVFTWDLGMWRSKDSSQESVLVPLWLSRIELRSPGLCGKSFYLLNHLASPSEFFYLVEPKGLRNKPQNF